MKQLPTRQVHLDFHTSEYIPDVAGQFNGEEFAAMAKDAHVNSMTVFARCVHGFMYYPSQKFPERVHPTLVKRNLLQEQVKALHHEGIKAPVYIAVQWDRFTAERHPEWLVRKRDGSHEGHSFVDSGFDQALCVNTDFYKFLEEHTMEVMDLLGDELDGLFFDMVGTRPCYCSACRKEMRALGIDMRDDEAVRAFTKSTVDRFKERMSRKIRERKPDCTIFYNAGHVGPCTAASQDAYSHFELESLPAGWGYLHFPITARYVRLFNKDCLGMTGKFHREWGDFHSLKNLAALEFEAFRILSYGFAISIGDQLEPYGKLNPAAYRLIGKVYSQVEEYEEYARPSEAVTEAALITGEPPIYEQRIPKSIMGAAQMLEELGLQFDIVDCSYELAGYKLVILPDELVVTEEMQEKLDEYVEAGGRVLSCGKGGLSQGGRYPRCFQADYEGEEKMYPSFLVPEGTMARGLEEGCEYVHYMKGESIRPVGSGAVLLEARKQYFQRDREKFCSHVYTPSDKGELFPAAVRTERTVLLAHPMFGQYRVCAPFWCKQLISNALDELLDSRLVRHNGPSSLVVNLRYQPQKNRYCIHLLSYIPIRKSEKIDIIEERTVVNQVELQLNLPKEIEKAYTVVNKAELVVEGGKVVVPCINGYEILVLDTGGGK
ncbi:alpha-amylase family protein [Murimonas intestini]|uniref:Beta-galactosidase-like protein n=1 Tax=Murimonas intestini TaxID=1337051 RepID=A0AB73SXX5_9FIRM|nr:alpha-amylase family protein [Murimonas intestini]MCR1843343.1 beta-galactosidase trimerization domain-containing protein [Murimonas intestini]MCR1865706.1 beta-galactosidase trimerization domain-containing protein [Murimonas intestini]MCR1886175.1 beta-galactosidase trimerization domain-containing protein [Murimonas intestini]